MESKIGASHPDPALVQEQTNIRKRIVENRKLLKILNQMQPDLSSEGFSSYLYDLAVVSRNGIWMTDIDLDLAKGHVVMNGIAREASEVPFLFRDLGETEAYRTLRISDLSIAKSSNEHQFTVKADISSEVGANGP